MHWDDNGSYVYSKNFNKTGPMEDEGKGGGVQALAASLASLMLPRNVKM